MYIHIPYRTDVTDTYTECNVETPTTGGDDDVRPDQPDDDGEDTDTDTKPTDTDPETGEKEGTDDTTDYGYSVRVRVGAIFVSIMVSVAFSLISL
ncbi:MAG: hypothetical protein EZS28_039448 [Streblomastix strix]|uniref:Uncharacterized protein n=1 Tax=Streblomastix strix TaxID=222440 RepID=A0A5J4U5R5_9EUKA|nr:MAG: hypothetical protein EZS28_039448 [Streblomastix strix]